MPVPDRSHVQAAPERGAVAHEARAASACRNAAAATSSGGDAAPEDWRVLREEVAAHAARRGISKRQAEREIEARRCRRPRGGPNAGYYGYWSKPR